MATPAVHGARGSRDPCPPESGLPEAGTLFAEPLTAEVRFGQGQDAAVERADVLAIAPDHIKLAMPTCHFHQAGEVCEVRFELNGVPRVLGCTLLWFSMHELVSLMAVALR